jgi:hypothetical protein
MNHPTMFTCKKFRSLTAALPNNHNVSKRFPTKSRILCMENFGFWAVLLIVLGTMFGCNFHFISSNHGQLIWP